MGGGTNGLYKTDEEFTMEKQAMKKVYLVILALCTPIICYSQHVYENAIHNVPIVKIVDTSFYSAIDTLFDSEKENGVARDTNDPIFVNVHKDGLVRITSLKSRPDGLPCIPKDIVEETLITVHGNRVVYIIFFGIDATEWVKEIGPASPVLTCVNEKEDDTIIVEDEESDYSCVLVYAIHDKMHIRVIGKEVVPYSLLFE